MEKKAMAWKTKGMNRDTSVSAFSSDFAYENRNLRLSTNEDNTTMSWVTEKGTLLMTLQIDTKPWKEKEESGQQPEEGRYTTIISGIPLGTAVLNHQLVLFTAEDTTVENTPVHVDRIYVLKYADEGSMTGILLYKGYLHFDTNYPLETLVSYEAGHVEKVYWTDGYNQPRLINIAAGAEKLKLWNHVDNNNEATAPTGIDTFFDFIPTVALTEKATITKSSSGGTFAPGVIQYCFTYVNKYGQQSNVVWVSPLQYLAFTDRGASPEEKAPCSFTIKFTGLDTSFDYVRLYSVQRSSLNLDVFAKILEDIPITGESISYTDNGTTGTAIDPFELLYAGGKEITALTMVDKDNTLFLGNFEEKTQSVRDLQEHFLKEENRVEISFDYTKSIALDTTNKYYVHTNTLNKSQQEITTFKGGENYRFGFQLQKSTGEWSEPVFLNDAVNNKYPYNNIFRPYNSLVSAMAEFTIPLSLCEGYKRVRPVIVYPNINDRRVLCQGVLNPTVFNVEDRKDNSPYSQASWYFRPYVNKEELTNGDIIIINDNLVYGTEYGEVSTDASPTGIQLDSDYFSNHSYTKTCHILVADLESIPADDVIRNGKIIVIKFDSEHGIKDPHEYSFDCAIRINNVVDIEPEHSKYIFIRFGNEDWGQTVNVYQNDLIPPNIQGTTIFQKGGEEGLTNIYIFNNQTIWANPNVENGIPDSSNNLLYYNHADYDANTNPPEKVELLLHYISNGSGRKHYFRITFNSANIVNISGVEEGEGTSLEFMHYHSLPTFEDIYTECNPSPNNEKISISDISAFKTVEIQNSINTYDNPFSTDKRTVNGEQFSSNTQFFVDQSIVTLNSPDIEFDTDVQVWGTDGLKLRVVGIIPITANISSHSISASSSMLDAYFNRAYDYANLSTTSTSGGNNGSSSSSEGNESNDDDPTVNTLWSDKYWEYRNSASFTNTKFGQGEIDTNIKNGNISYHAGNRLVADLLWHDTILVKTDYYKVAEHYLDDATHAAGNGLKYFMVYPWHKEGPLNNDWRIKANASSWLDVKREANALFSINTEYISGEDNGEAVGAIDYPYISAKIHLTENGNIVNYKLKKQCPTSSTINYYPNVDKVLYNSLENYVIQTSDNTESPYAMEEYEKMKLTSPIQMKYKSTSHAVIAFLADFRKDTSIPLLPCKKHKTEAGGAEGYYTGFEVTGGMVSEGLTFWGDTVKFTQDNKVVDMTERNSKYFDFLWLGELYKEPINAFGGYSLAAIRSNKWQIGGDTVDIGNDGKVSLVWSYGDTYFQRYDCLKTFAASEGDTNQIVEILSFMCETHVNIDGRYDKNRGQLKNYAMRPDLFNLWNPAYSQKDNFFIYQQLEHDKQEDTKYPNQVIYSKAKTSGADVDLWTNVTLASILELDGDKGSINKLARLNDQVLAFQDTGVAQILYNENAQISTTQGVPIELGNSGKVQGARYLSDSIGCSNKWSLINTPSGIYFMDSNSKSIYLFNGQWDNVSLKGGMNTWVKNNVPASNVKWTPDGFDNFVTYYDKLNQDIMFINEDTCLDLSERIGAFTSFYDYGNTPYFCNLDDIGIWVGKSRDTNKNGYYLWQHRAGNYCKFFDVNSPYSMILIGNAEPLVDKTFTNIEFRACVDTDGVSNGSNITTFHLPFDTLETWNEYQHGIATLSQRNGNQGMLHHLFTNDAATLRRDFRIWRCDIPRDNATVNATEEAKMHITRLSPKPLNRMRNPWVYIKLIKNAENNLNRTEIHDIVMTYWV